MPNTPRLGRETGRTRMVVGFAFNPSLTRVALILKRREPDGADMIGTLNGIGGKVQTGETYAHAMAREFLQEAGVVVSQWEPFALAEGDSWRLTIYRATLTAWEWRRIRVADQSTTDEQVRRVHVNRLPYGDGASDNIPAKAGVYRDVRWLVPLALDREPKALVRIDYRSL